MPKLATLLLVPLALAVVAAPGRAQETEPARVELVGGGAGEDGALLAGLRIRLADGYRTYWRHPGDSGVPPRFDFRPSSNVAEVTVEWPAPSVHHDGFGRIVGYKEEIVFPLLVTPRDASRPVELAVDLDFAVCADICIPLSDSAVLTLDGTAAVASEVNAWRAKVPLGLERGDPRGGVESVAYERDEGGDALRIAVRRMPEPVAAVLLEGPEGWGTGVAEPDGTAREGVREFAMPVDGPPPGSGDAQVRVTVVTPGLSFEQSVPVD